MLTYHFPPSAASGAFRLLGFAEHLPRFGWQCVVVAPPSLPWEATDRALLERVPPETALCYVDYPSRWPWKPLTRFFPGGAWLPFAATACYRAIRRYRPDAVLSSGPAHHIHLLGRHLHRWLGLPWVADFRDPWVAGDRSPMTWEVRGWEKRAEPSVMREADALILNTPGARDLLQEAYPQHAAKMTSITNGYDPEPFEIDSVPPLSGATIEIVHTGVVYANRSPGPFLDAVRGLETAATAGRDLRIRFIGEFSDQSKKDEIVDKVRGGLNASVTVEGRVPYLQSVRAMIDADVLLLLDSPRRRTGVPAKLYEYIGAGRPILALAEHESDVAWVLRESGLPHRVAPPLDPEAIRRAFAELLRDPAISCCGAPNRPRPARFARRHLAGELAALLDSLVQGAPSYKVGRGLMSEVVQ
jgi:glycosyltransferase involved in cell wall biosynthesis